MRTSSGAQALSENVARVTQAIDHTAGTSTIVGSAAASLNSNAAQLSQQVQTFFDTLRQHAVTTRKSA